MRLSVIFVEKMSIWGEYEFSSEAEDRLNEICLKLGAGKSSELFTDWLALLNYNSPRPEIIQMEVDANNLNSEEEEILNTIKEALKNETALSEKIFVGTSVNSLSRILVSVGEFLDEFGFCTFCRFLASWTDNNLIEQCIRSVVLPKLKEIKEATGCITFAIKELAIKNPEQLCQNLLVPLLFDNTFQFTDVELLSAVFSVLPTSQKDFLILNFTKKSTFLENDWFLLHPLIKDSSQNSLFNLLICIQKFSCKFSKSQIFGRFLVNFCKNLHCIGDKDALRKVIENHQTLLKIQAMKYLDSA